MSHEEQLMFVGNVKGLFPKKFDKSKVLEVGSLNINGTVRDFFNQCEYIGIDIGPGPGVDLVVGGHVFDEQNNTFDTVISCECFEHNPYWKETFANMYRMSRPGGLIIMTCAYIGRPEHGTSRTTPANSPLTISMGWEYYKNLSEHDFRENFELDSMFEVFKFEVNESAKDLYFFGIKK